MMLAEETLERLTPAQRRVWVALVVREKAISWGGEGLRFLSTRDLAEESGIPPSTIDSAVARMVELGIVRTVPRFVPAGWDGDPSRVVGRRDPWHTVRVADDYELIPDRRGACLDIERKAAQDGVVAPNGPTSPTLRRSVRNG